MQYQKQLEISASDIAKLIAEPTHADAEALEYGKKCEEAISTVIYMVSYGCEFDYRCPDVSSEFQKLSKEEFDKKIEEDDPPCSECDRCKRRILNEDNSQVWGDGDLQYDSFCSMKCLFDAACEIEELDEFQTKLARKLLEAGVQGRTPPTQSIMKRGIEVFAKPDIWNPSIEDSDYHEFKTYPLNDYARAQSKVFAWVLDSDINLYGFDGENIQHELIKKESIKDSEIPDFRSIARETDTEGE
ncbi:MAG: hypothetical protein ACYCO0_03470 [Candidatus Micrarchaeaceae archaeon]